MAFLHRVRAKVARVDVLLGLGLGIGLLVPATLFLVHRTEVFVSLVVALCLNAGVAVAMLVRDHLQSRGRQRYRVKVARRTERSADPPEESRLVWHQRIQEALAHDRFVLYAMPILDLATDRISHYELLVRMSGRDGEVIEPGRFLETAERFGLIQQVDQWVARRAIQLLADHHRAGRQIAVSVNVSGASLTGDMLLVAIQHELTARGVDPSYLGIEITESAAIVDLECANRFVERLRARGCRFFLDDFGSGFASFSQLKNLRVDYLKIDGSLVRHLADEVIDQQMVKAIVTMARGLGKRTVAEYVEGGETLAMLRELGVDQTQGYHIGRPFPVQELGMRVGHLLH